MRRRRLVVPAVALAAAVALAGCSGGADQAVTPVAAPQSVSPSAVPSESASPTAPAPSTAPTTAAPPTASAAPAGPEYDVAAVQRQLTALKYYGGAVDGKAGPALRSAVMAFQKVQGLSADGVVGPATLAALAAPEAPQLKASSPADRVEVDLTKQVLYVVERGGITRVLPVSSGNGETYRQRSGGTARALTPVGWYTIERRIVGERKADLGSLFDPQYFYRGWAIHGSNSVPAVPASHGCVRVTRWDAKWLLGQIGVGTSVYLYGGTHTFSAGSSAAGTEDPTGDVGGAAPPAARSAAPAPTTPAATASATTTPAPTATPSTGAPTASATGSGE